MTATMIMMQRIILFLPQTKSVDLKAKPIKGRTRDKYTLGWKINLPETNTRNTSVRRTNAVELTETS